jgi:NADH:ubiquinone reductase (H+-translocating)
MSSTSAPHPSAPRLIIIGGGFAGLQVLQTLPESAYHITLIDKRNFHLFQPLLYQVATGTLSAPDISAPLRSIVRDREDIYVVNDEVIDIDTETKIVVTKQSSFPFDYLVVAAGASHSYFGKDELEEVAPGLKTIEDALRIRSSVFHAFERAEISNNPAERVAWTTFCIVGGGPTGVELAGALSEIAKKTLREEYSTMDTSLVDIHLIEASPRILGGFHPSLSKRAHRMLSDLGVVVHTSTRAENITHDSVTLVPSTQPSPEGIPVPPSMHLPTHTVIWAAGVQASPLGALLSKKTGATIDKAGKVLVSPYLTLPSHDHIFVIGDLASIKSKKGHLLPGIAPVAMSQGRYVAKTLNRLAKKKAPVPYHYFNKGVLAVIGRNRAVAEVGALRFAGFLAWSIWAFIHIWYLVAFRNRIAVFINWAWEYFTYRKNARLILKPHHMATQEQREKIRQEAA